MVEEKYDSRVDTEEHIARVADLLEECEIEVWSRGCEHDESKLKEPEKPLFDTFTPLLKGLTYGSDEYKEALAGLKPALDHHYANNSHHPEHYKNGIDGMCLFDLIEMLCDWKAATERHDDGDIYNSLEINKARFHMSEQLARIFTNTVDRYHFLTETPTK